MISFGSAAAQATGSVEKLLRTKPRDIRISLEAAMSSDLAKERQLASQSCRLDRAQRATLSESSTYLIGGLVVRILAFSLVACSQGPRNEAAEELAQNSQAIVGGTEAGRGNWPSVVAISSTKFSHQPWGCTGTLIAPTWVLSCGHCFSNNSTSPPIQPIPSDYYVYAGRYNIVTDTGGQQLSVNQIMLPDGYDPDVQEPDIALIQLSQPATVAYSRLASPARMAEVPTGAVSTLLGWGETTLGNANTLSAVLRKVDIPISWYVGGGDQYALGDQEMEFFTTGPNYLGTGGGDSGGPTFVQRDGEWFIVGVHSWASIGGGIETAADVPVASYFDWVISKGASPNPSYLPSAQISVLSAML
jgi:secreted trypsin-like serine protease